MSQESEPRATPTPLRMLPSVDHVLNLPAIVTLLDEFPRGELVRAVRAAIDSCRNAIRDGRGDTADQRDLAMDIRQRLYRRTRRSLRRVINATGIVLHTGLGRAPLADDAVEAIVDVAAGYSNLELDLQTGRRGDRHAHLKNLLCELTGAKDALVVNNNAAATYLTLNTLAKDREAIISRGELVEIGGSYRMPDIMAAAACHMVEVGSTNRTRIEDYERAVTERTAVLLHVHTSNYRIQGFVQSPALSDLVALGRSSGLIVIHDLGSGLLIDPSIAAGDGSDANETADDSARDETVDDDATRDHDDGDGEFEPMPQWDEPGVCESVAAGADVTLFSGDKLLGGPQAGIILGRPELTARIRKNPLMRTFRPDKMTLAGLEATLRLYRDPDTLCQKLPAMRMLSATPAALKSLAADLGQRIARAIETVEIDFGPDTSFAGGGSLPTIEFPTYIVRVRHPQIRPAALADALRTLDVPVICRVGNDALLLDCRTLIAADADQIAAALADVVRDLAPAE